MTGWQVVMGVSLGVLISGVIAVLVGTWLLIDAVGAK